MTDFSDWGTAARAVVDPSTSASDLAAIAQFQPGLRAQVAVHPNVYPGLSAWLETNGVARQQPVAQQPVVPQVAPQMMATPQMAPMRQMVPGQPAAAPYGAQPGQMPFAYQGAYAAPVGAPAAHRSKTPFVIGGAVLVVLVVVAVVLLVLKPWQSKGPTLTVDQFVSMVNNDPDTFGTSGSVTVQDVQQSAASGQQDWFNYCSACSRYMNNLKGAIDGDDNPTMLFDSVANASGFSSAVNEVLKAELGAATPGQYSPEQEQVQTTSGGVWLMTIWDGNSEDGGYMAQYGNVVTTGQLSCTTASDCSSQGQSVADTFKADVDRAAKG